MIKDVLEALKLVSEGIGSVKLILDAVKTGANYLKVKHPEVQGDVQKLVAELGKSIGVIEQASAVLTNFRFAIATDNRGSELARFNDYFIKSKAEAQFLRDHIEDLRTHCGKVRDHANQIAARCKSNGFVALFATALNLRDPQLEEELAKKLDRLAFEDFEVANAAHQMVASLEQALLLVQNALGTSGAMYPQNLSAAADVLAAVGPAFEQIEQQASQALREVQQSAASLG